MGDLSSRGSPTHVKMPTSVKIVMVTAGSHHTAALTSDGDVLTWGAHLVNFDYQSLYRNSFSNEFVEGSAR